MSSPKPSRMDRLRATHRAAARLRPYLGRHRTSLSLAGGATVLFLLFDLAKPWPMKIVIDQVILGEAWAVLPPGLSGKENAARVLWIACLALPVFATMAGAFAYARMILLARVGERIVARIRGDLHERLLGLSLGFHGRSRTGDLVVRLTGDVSMMKTLLVEGLFELVQNLLLAVAMIGVMLLLDTRLALLAVVTVPPIALLLIAYGGRIRQAARGQRKKEGRMAAAVGESLAAIPVIQAFSLEGVASERFQKQNRKSRRAGLAAARLEGAMSRWTEISLAAGTAVILIAGTQRVLAGHLTAGELLVFISYVRMLYKPLRRVVATSAKLFKSSAGAERILHVLDAPSDLPVKPDARALEEARGEIVLERVSLDHGPGRHALREVDLTIRPGRRVALVGENGSGKTSLLSLLPRLRDPSSGVVRLDGHDLRDLDLVSLRRQVSVVFQDAVLFDGSILENVRLGLAEATEAEVLDAARRAGVMDFARSLPDGLDTKVGEQGGALSGGQRQRVALARALLRRTPVVLLDEPAASLDAETADVVTAEVLEGLSGSTVIISTHRFDLLDRFDEVVVLAGGRVVERGPANTLTTRPGPSTGSAARTASPEWAAAREGDGRTG